MDLEPDEHDECDEQDGQAEHHALYLTVRGERQTQSGTAASAMRTASYGVRNPAMTKYWEVGAILVETIEKE